MLSPQSVTRPWINFEAGWAWAQDKVTIPACFGGLDVGSMPRPYSDLQGIQLESGYTRLITDVAYHLKRPTLPDLPTPDTAKEFRDYLKGIRPPVKIDIAPLVHVDNSPGHPK